MGVNPDLKLKLGLGGIVSGKLMTFDYVGKESLRPYLCQVDGRDFQYGLKRQFIDCISKKKFPNKLNDRTVVSIIYPLKPFVLYEYKRFMGPSFGEIVEGYFAITAKDIIELEYDEVMQLCSNTRQKLEKRSERKFEVKKIYVPKGMDPNDVPF